MDTGREPCPWVILTDAGGAFSMGVLAMQVIGGTIWHGVKGARNSPAGERGIGAMTAIKSRVPVLGGNFAAFGGLLGLYTCAVTGIRHKEDPWNGIAAGLLTGGSLAIRSGYKAARNNAIGCGLLMAVFEGVGIVVQRAAAGSTRLY
ncbi:mitochondrial import inner membrane translocase subunit [Colletotrichum truncatum]|uniref:Mitochondrial import inner membrane translocase subunit n=1 Tax=Colletotrichum truncatum TaxID=5467 RepID=A0ACC3YYE0_COLTU|nr:mitochondrial import inner membrane translocase subunit [Colletotrichum truncatum]KAF6782106.1 mitochondrial import inner membrane translocase subunit [Colletotrichum truncatum]